MSIRNAPIKVCKRCQKEFRSHKATKDLCEKCRGAVYRKKVYDAGRAAMKEVKSNET